MNWWKLTFLSVPYALFGLEWMLLRRGLRRGWAFWVLTGVGLVGASKFVGFQVLGGDAFNPELPVWVLIAWGWLESCVWIACPLALCGAVCSWVVRPFRRWCAWSVVGLSAVLAAYGMWEGVRVPPVVEREVVCEGLPQAFDGYRVAHLSDLHASSAARRGKMEEIVARVNAAQVDLVAITGDFVDGVPARRARDLEPLADLRAKDGVWACMGNHEKYWRFAGWERYFGIWNVRMLRNAWTSVTRGDDRLVIGGMDDDALGVRPERVFAHAPELGFRILLYHRPTRCAVNARELKVGLQLSGHTHGGAMPIIDRFVARVNEGHVRGFYREGGLVLHVSPGSGQWAGFPLRLFDSPEITVLVLRDRLLPDLPFTRGMGIISNRFPIEGEAQGENRR